MKRANLALIAAAVALVLLLSSVFIVDERRQALVLAFGKVDRIVAEPGLHFKLPPPFNSVVFYEKRILPLETDLTNVLPLDRKRRAFAAFARWRITDPQRFREAVGDEQAALSRLERILSDSLGKILGSEQSDAVLSNKREDILRRTLELSAAQAKELGVDILDVRIRTWFLPDETLNSTYDRMRSDRDRIARDALARGEEAARRIRASAEREAVEILAEARREAETIMGEADASRNKIFAESYGKNEEFFAFHRSLRAYERSLRGNNSTMVISPDSDFFEYLKNEAGPAAQ